MSTLVTVQDTETHTRLTMDDGKANALSFAMLDALNAGLDSAEAAGKPVLLDGRPGKFSAGFDLSIMGGDTADMLRLLRQGADTAVRLLRFETPVVLGVTGHALAMGALLCLSADYRLGVRGPFKLGLNEVAIGMTLPWFGVELARARLEETQFTPAVALAQIYDPDGAADAGYLDKAVAAEEFEAELDALMAGLGSLNMTAHRETKARVREPLLERLEQAMARDFSAAA